MTMKTTAAASLRRLRENAPLVHCITNFVVMNSTANILLSLGASPVMAHSRREVEEMVGLAGALVINIGTLAAPWVEAMVLAAGAANAKGIPVILDPVGAGATSYRNQAVRRILKEAGMAVIRGNASEVLSLDAANVSTRGVDSSLTVSDAMMGRAAAIARRHQCIVVISGATDLVTDGERVLRVSNGVPLMTRVTGLGCGQSAVVGAFCAVGGDDRFAAVGAAVGFYGLCGELALKVSDRPGSFYVAFLDALYAAGKTEIDARLRVDTGVIQRGGHASLPGMQSSGE